MSATLVIFGATGDLTSRKLIPALYALYRKKRLPENTRIIGSARTPNTDEQFRNALTETTKKFSDDFDAGAWAEFSKSIFYQAGDIEQANDYEVLGKRLTDIEGSQPATRIYYLATSPKFYATAVAGLGAHGLADESQAPRRIVIEKPFGFDLTSAVELNAAVHAVFKEKQVFRIDHYLGKETVQNLLVLRFANTIFEPVWNRNYVDHVQITVAEEVLIGRRGAYYEQSGILRDMFQNHLLQLLMVTAMEAPVRYESESVRDEKVKVLGAIHPMTAAEVATNTLRGQYSGYRKEKDVAPDSETATFAAVRLAINNWRWQGVPFYLRSGKGMSCRTTQIVIQFRRPPHMVFQTESRRINDANRLVIQVQPAEGIQLSMETKIPDAGMKMRTTEMGFQFAQQFHTPVPDAYQRLLLDTLQGDASLFARADEVEAAWSIIDPIEKAWREAKQPELLSYEPGLWGPEASSAWMEAHGRQWFDSCPVLS